MKCQTEQNSKTRTRMRWLPYQHLTALNFLDFFCFTLLSYPILFYPSISTILLTSYLPTLPPSFPPFLHPSLPPCPSLPPSLPPSLYPSLLNYTDTWHATAVSLQAVIPAEIRERVSLLAKRESVRTCRHKSSALRSQSIS